MRYRLWSNETIRKSTLGEQTSAVLVRKKFALLGLKFPVAGVVLKKVGHTILLSNIICLSPNTKTSRLCAVLLTYRSVQNAPWLGRCHIKGFHCRRVNDLERSIYNVERRLRSGSGNGNDAIWPPDHSRPQQQGITQDMGHMLKNRYILIGSTTFAHLSRLASNVVRCSFTSPSVPFVFLCRIRTDCITSFPSHAPINILTIKL